MSSSRIKPVLPTYGRHGEAEGNTKNGANL